MPSWNNNDREESKPTWLTPAQKRECVRTVKGWELPVSASISNVAGQFEGTKDLGTTASIPQWELLVALPVDPSVTGATASNYAVRDTPTFYGATASSDTAFAPYFAFPFQGDSATAGGFDSTGLSYSDTTNFGLNGYGVSTLNWSRSTGLTTGATGYIKVIANDVNQTNTLSITMAGPSAVATGWQFFTGADLLDSTKVPVAVYESMFGPTAVDNQSIGVVRLTSGLAARTYGLTATVGDGGLTGTSFFTITVVN